MSTQLFKISKSYDSLFEIARKYYSIVFDLGNIKVTTSELDLIAFSAVNGTISTPPVRDEFIKEFKVPKGSVYNMVSKLQKMKIFVKDTDNKVRVNKQILPDFNNELLLTITINKNAN